MECLQAHGIVRDSKFLKEMYDDYEGLPLRLSAATDVFRREERNKAVP